MTMRARNIKPGYFKNEELAACNPLARLLFAGLWCLADRHGRVADRPTRIKAEVLPYDECDVDALLSQLADRNFIIRYESQGIRCLWIPGFQEHQHPHPKEAATKLPPPESSGESNVIQGNDINDQPAKNLGSEVNKDIPCPSSSSLNPPSLNPSSLNPPSMPTPGAGGSDPNPEILLAHEWAFGCTRRRRGIVADRAEDVAPEFAEMLRLGCPADALMAAIKDPKRDHNEHLWQFRQRMTPKATGPPGMTGAAAMEAARKKLKGSG